MKTIAIIQARMNSSRLPGKVLMDLAGKPLIQRVVDRARASGVYDDVVLATSTEKSDDPLAAYAEKNKIAVFRGNLNDVLDRYVQAAKQYSADVVVRLTGDCPLLDPAVLRETMKVFTSGKYDYVSNFETRHYPDGLDNEVIAMKTLVAAHRDAKLPSEREHVTPYIRNHGELFRIGGLTLDRDLSHHRWTVDEPRDLELARAIYKHFGQTDFGMNDVIVFLKQHPELQALNADIPTNEGMKTSLEEDKKYLQGGLS